MLRQSSRAGRLAATVTAAVLGALGLLASTQPASAAVQLPSAFGAPRHLPNSPPGGAPLVAVRADGPLRLGGQITDKVGALNGRTPEVEAALARLRNDTGLQLFVVFVRSFDGTPARQWTDQTAARSDLGNRDALLAVATGDRAYAYSVDQNFPLTDAQLDEVAAVAIEPALAQNDWADAVIGAADGYRAALAGQPIPKPNIVPGAANPGGSGVGGAGGVVIVLIVVAGAAVLGVFVWFRLRRKPAQPAKPALDPNDPFPSAGTPELNDRANTMLVELDDALRTSERELALATGEYGAEATGSFTEALRSAKTDVAEAFRVRMELEDVPKEDEIGTRRRLAEIIKRCEAADARLDAESDAFDALRELETRLEQSIPTLTQRRTDIETSLPTVATEVADLQRQFVGQALAAVVGNPDQARDRLQFAAAALTKASEELSSGHRPAAALTVRAAEQALDQTEQLLAAVGKVGADLRAAKEAVQTLLVEVDSDLAAGRAAQGSQQPPPASGVQQPAQPPGTQATSPAPTLIALAAAMASTEQAAASARTALQSPTMDPLSELRRLREADGALDQALGDVRDAVERASRARAMLDQAILAARAEISAATDFVNTRRGAVGQRARALLAEAQRHLDRAIALSTDDPVTALAEAQQADQSAEQATRAAQSDVDQWSNYQRNGPGGFAGGGSGLDGLAGAILGGILVAGASGRRGGGFGGGFGGFGGGFGGGMRGGGGGFGGHSPGGFGGRRGGGGRF